MSPRESRGRTTTVQQMGALRTREPYRPTRFDALCHYAVGSFLAAGAAFAAMNLSATGAEAVEPDGDPTQLVVDTLPVGDDPIVTDIAATAAEPFADEPVLLIDSADTVPRDESGIPLSFSNPPPVETLTDAQRLIDSPYDQWLRDYRVPPEEPPAPPAPATNVAAAPQVPQTATIPPEVSAEIERLRLQSVELGSFVQQGPVELSRLPGGADTTVPAGWSPTPSALEVEEQVADQIAHPIQGPANQNEGNPRADPGVAAPDFGSDLMFGAAVGSLVRAGAALGGTLGATADAAVGIETGAALGTAAPKPGAIVTTPSGGPMVKPGSGGAGPASGPVGSELTTAQDAAITPSSDLAGQLAEVNVEFRTTDGGGVPSPQVSEWARRVAEVHPTLTQSEAIAIYEYTGMRGPVEINPYLRDPASAPTAAARAEGQGLADATSQALAKLTPTQGTSFRGTSMTPEAIESIRPGETWSDRGFLSSSSQQSVGNSFAGNVLGESHVEMVIYGRSGVNVAPLSMMPAEAEVLFRPGTVFEVVSKKMHDGRWTIVLREPPSPSSPGQPGR